MAYNKRQKLQDNIKALEVAFDLAKSGRAATESEREVLRKYSGFGGLKFILNPCESESDVMRWNKSDKTYFADARKLYDLLKNNAQDEKEYRSFVQSMRNSVLSSFYTPQPIVDAISGGLKDAGVEVKTFLDPSSGKGTFIDSFRQDHPDLKVTAFEKDLLTGLVLKSLHGDSDIHVAGYETIHEDYKNQFDVAASNIPFGDVNVFDPVYANSGDAAKVQATKTLHNYFFMKTLDEVRDGGLVAFITSQGVMDSTRNKNIRRAMLDKAYLVGAVRLPNNLFVDEAGTEVGSDLILLQKDSHKPADYVEYEPEERAFVENLSDMEAKNPQSSIENDFEKDEVKWYRKTNPNSYIFASQFFWDGESPYLGEISRGTDPYGKAVTVCQWNGTMEELGQALRARVGFFMQYYFKHNLYKEHAPVITVIEEKPIPAQGEGVSVTENLSMSEGQQVVSSPTLSSTGQPSRKKKGEVSSLQMSLFDLWDDQPQVVEQGSKANDRMKPRAFAGNVFLAHYRNGVIIEDAGQMGTLSKTDGVWMFKPLSLPRDTEDRLRQYVKVRDVYEDLYRTEAENQEEYAQGRADLNVSYDEFVRRFGALNERKSMKAILMDACGRDMLCIERAVDGKYVKSDIFEKPVAFAVDELTHVETAEEALMASLNRSGDVDLAYMSDLCDLTEDELRERLREKIYYNPMVRGYEIAERFLSGNVVEKMDYIEDNYGEKVLAAGEEEVGRSYKALQGVRPRPIPFEELDFNFGERWMPTSYFSEFATEFFGTEIQVEYAPNLDEFVIKCDEYWVDKITSEYAVQGESKNFTGLDLLRHALYDTTPIINKVVGYRANGDPIMGPDHEKMQLAASKIDAIREGFNEWIQGHPAKWKEAVADMYNRKFNCFVRANYDGSHQTFPDLDLKALKEKKGISDIYGSQKDAVWMILQNGGGICDHEVGTGKTLIMCLAAHEMKRLGMCHKPIIIGMKANVNEIAATYQSAYPNDRILYAPTESKDFKDRESFFNRMKNNDWDCIIMSHDQFNRIPQSEEVMRDVMYEEMQALEEALDVYAKQSRNGISSRMLKGLETRKENLAVELANLNYKLRNRADDVVDFKTMGIDHIFVDESQQYKNLPFTTRNNRVAGLGDPKGSQRARNLQYAIRTIQDRTGKDLGATFLSGTTISNSLTELYLLFKYLRPHALDTQDIHSFDAWAAIFARKSRDYEINVAGQIVMKERYRHFIKVPELAAFYNEITDYKTAVDVGLERPKMKVSLVNIQPTEDHQDFSKRLLEFAQSGNGELVFRPELNDSELQAKMLLVTGMGKKASLSPKLVNPEYHEGDDTKIGFAARNIADYYRRYDEQKGTQFVFCDLSTPKKGEWSAYQELKDKLVNDYGIPEEEIQFIQDHGTERKRKAVIDKMNKGEVRVLIGSTTTLGTGVNAQERAVAVHHLDLPWRPSDMEQRNGRAVRKGNLVARDFADNKVDVLVYAVERSLDSYNFYLLQAKSDFIRQMKTGSLGKREFDQGGEDEENGMPFAEYVAITSGNTDLLERAKLEKRILGLESERKAFYKQQQVVQRKLDDARSQLTYQENILGKLEQDKKALEEVLSFKVDSNVDAFEALRDDSGLLSYTSDGRNVQLQHLTFDLTQDEPLGDYLQKTARQEVNGEADVLHLVEDGFDWTLVMTSQTEYNIKTGVNRWVGNHFAVRGESGILYTYNNGKVSLVSKKLAASYPFMAVARIPELIEAHEAKRDMYAKHIPELERIVGKEWEKAEELKNLKTQMQELDKKINMEMDIKTLQQQGQVTLPEQLPYEIEHHSYGRQPWELTFAVKDFPFLTHEDLDTIGDRYHGNVRSHYGEVHGDFRHQFGAEQAFKDLSKLNAEHRGDLDWLKQAASDIYDPSSVYAAKRLNEIGYDRHGNPLTGEDASRMKVISLGDYSIPEIRDLAHGVKDLHGVATEVAAATLSKVVSEMPDADKVVLVPMPGHKGYGGGAEKLCRLMSDLYDIPYENVLYSSSFESLYVWKKQHPNEPLPDLLFGARMDRINGKIPVLVDNVIDTGHTARAALDAIGGNPVMLVVGSTGKHEAEGDNIDVEVLDKGLELVHENTPEGVGFTGISRKEFDNLLKLAQRFDDSSNAWKANHELHKYGIDKYTGYPLYMVEHICDKWDLVYEDLDEPVKELMSKGFADNVFTQEELERISPEDMKMFREAYVAAQDPDHIDYGYRRRLMVLYDVIREKLGIGVEQDAVGEAKDISMPRETVASDKGKMTVYAVDTYENDRFGGDLKSRANALLIYDNDATRLQAYGFWDRVISNLEKSDRERLVLVPMQFNQDESTAFLSKAVLAMWKHYQNKSLQEYKSIELRDTLRKVDDRWEFKDDVDPSKLYMLVDINMNDGHRLTQAREAFPENCEVKGLVLTYDPDFSEDYGNHIQVVTSKELEDERKAEYEADKEQTLNGYEAALEAFKGVTHLQPEEALDAQKLLWGSWNAPFAKENIRQKLLDEFDIDWQTGKRARFEYVDNTSANEGTSHVAEDDNTIRHMKGENYFSVREEGDLYVVDLGTKIDVLFDDMPEWFGKTDHELNGMFEKVTGVDGAVNNRGTFLERENAEQFAAAANEHYEHKLRELEEVASSRHTVQSKLRDALIDRMRKAGISVVTDVQEGQRVLNEANGRMDNIKLQNDYIRNVNDVFNHELEMQIAGTQEKHHVYRLGYPSDKLLSAGFPSLQIEMLASKLIEKSDDAYLSNHPFTLDEVKGLPAALQSPIAVFDSATKPNRKVALVELEHEGVNFVVAVQLNASIRKKGEYVEVNSIRSLYPKDNVQAVVDWINSGNLLKYVDKEKALNWLTRQRSNSADAADPIKNLEVAAKVVTNFENSKLSDEKIREQREFLTEAYENLQQSGENDEKERIRLRFPQYQNEFTSLVKDLPIRHQEAADALAAYESSMKEKYGEEWQGLMNDDEDIHCVELQNAEYRLNPDEHEGYASIAYNQLVQRYGADYLLAFGHDDKNLIIKDELAAAFLMGVRQEMTDEDRVRVEQTEAFKDWFGDWQQYPDAASKVVDQNGRPMVMYHGTGAENAFSIFDLSKSGKSNTLAGVGFWFTPSKEFAKSWGEEVFYNRDGAHVLPVYLNIRNPKIYRPLTEEQVQEGERVKGELDAVREEISSINKQYENDYYHSVIGYYDLDTFQTAKRNGFVVDNDEESERIKEYYSTRSEHGREAMSDGEKVYQLMQREGELSKQYDFYRHPDPYEQFRYDVYTVAGRPQDANIGGLGMALSHPKDVLEQFREQLKAQGYDGIIIENTKYDRRYAGTETTTQYITFDANQIKSATQNIGRFRTENEDIRYHKVDTYPIFVSNAQLAVERIQQQKATPMQWLNMITKNGGIKAGEDKWMGLSVWLKENTSKTLTKGEVLDFISQNAIEVEEVNYVNPSDYAITKEDILESEAFQSLQDSFIEYDDDENPYVDQERFNQRRHEDNNFFNGFSIDYWGEGIDVDDPRSAALYLGLINGNRVREINDTRLGYTTEGLEKNREIALTVPSIEPWKEGDSIHFGDAGDGRVVVWVRFGETTVKKDVPYVKEVTEFEEPYTNYRGDEIYVPKGQSRFDMNDMIEKINPEAHYGKEGYYVYVDHAIVGFEPTMERAIEAMNEYYLLHPSVRQETERVLVVDEIQSKRHQDGRKVGYIPQYTEARARAYEAASKAYRAAVDAYREHVSKMSDKYGDFRQYDEGADPFTPGKRAIDRWRAALTEDERAEYYRLRKDMNDKQDVVISLQTDGFIDRSKVPDAPFERNWQELAMKRVLRYAADNGYDRVAWTTGEQQSERYNIGDVVDAIDVSPHKAQSSIEVDGFDVTIITEDRDNIEMYVTQEGIVSSSDKPAYRGKHLSEVVGESLSDKILSDPEGGFYQGEDLRLGGEGMRAFYDQILVNYMNKYGKQWGAQVEDVELSRLGYRSERPVMHSVVVNAAMKDSVLQGQPMFFKARDGRAYGFVKGGVIYIDRAIATAETPLHEYTHLWAEALRQKNPDEWKNVVELMKGATDIWNKVKREYPDLTDDDSIADEVLAQYSGKRGYQKLMDETKGQEDMSVLDKLAEALARFWKAVADFLHIHYTSKEQVADQVLHDLLTGVNPLEYADKMVDQRETESFKEWFGDWQNDAQNASKVVDAEGKPLVVEHATNADFTVFDMSHIGENSKDNGVFGAGFYFGTHAPGWMQGAKNIMKVYLDIKHPFEVTDDVVDIYMEIREKMDTPAMRRLVVKGFNDHEEHLGVLIDQIKYVDDLIKNHPNEVQEMMLKDEELEYVRPDDRLRVWREHEIMNRSGLGSLALSWQSFINHQIGSHEFTAAAIQDGYDGVIVDRGNDYKEFVVFEANQIKSATYNVGTFNLNSNDIRFHFIGEEGARQLDQNLGGNYNSFLEKAKYCENMGYAPHYIKFVTGWEKGIDGKWRYELGGIRDFNPYGNQDWLSRHPEVVRYRELHQRDVAQVMGIDGFQPLSEEERNEMEALAKDSNVRYFDGTATQKNPASLTVKDYMDAPMLFAAYPELRDLPVKVEPLTSNGKYVSEVDALTGDTSRYLVISDALVQSLRDMNASARQQMQDTFIHEIQHYIQEMEGFARGGNLSTVATMRRDEAQAKLDALRPVYEEYQYLDACIDSAEDSEMALQYYDAKDAFEKEHAHELKAYQVALDARHVAELDMVSGYLSDRNFIDYQRLAGEVEARNAVRRSGMSFRERWNSPISSTEDVPREEQIVNYRSSMAASLESPSTRKLTVADREAGGALVEQLEKMGITVHIDLEENRKKLREFLLDKSDAGKVRYMETEAGKVYGFSYKGEMYLDMRKVDAELPLARYAHLWAASMRRVNPDNWKHVVGMFKSDADTWKALQEAYPQYSNEDDLVEAAIVKYSGKQGAEKMQRQLQNMSTRDVDYKSRWGNIFQNVSRAIQDFWKHVGDSFNIRYSSKEELADQILKDFTNSVNPVKKVEKWLQERDKAYAEAVARNDIDTARDLFWQALQENVGNGITPFMAVDGYRGKLDRLARDIKDEGNIEAINKAADLMAPYIRAGMVLVPAPGHEGYATHTLALAHAISERSHVPVADVLVGVERARQYDVKKATGKPILAEQLGIRKMGELPKWYGVERLPVVIDNVVHSGNTAEACVKALGKGVVLSLASAVSQERHVASLKSLAPVVYGKDDQLIPLSKRFELKSKWLGRAVSNLSPADPNGFEVIEEVNQTFNEKLEELNEGNADSITFSLGRPSDILLSAGVTDMPMKLYGNKVIAKMRKHGFALEELQNLPMSVADPMAVFDNLGRKGNRSILTELITRQGNFLVTVDLGKDSDVDFNIISSVFGKRGSNVVDWINKGKATYINKGKALTFLSHQSAPIAAAAAKAELISAAKVVENFENPKLFDKKITEQPKKIQIQGLESYSLEDIKELVSAHVNGILEESFSGEDISIKEITVIGSRSRGEAHEGSDLDILVEYEGDGVREDAMFDALNEAPLEIEGIKVDINPINPHYSLSTSQWLERDAKWREQDANNSNQLNNSETMKSKVKQRNASTRDKLSNLLAGLLPNNGDRITVFDKGDSGLNDPRTFKEVGYIAREDGHYNYHQGEDQVDIYELQPEGDVVKKLYSRALAVEISDQLDEGQRFDNMKSLGSRYQGDGSFVRKENGLLYISGRADGEVVTDWLSVRPEVLEALSDEIEDRYDLLAARERLANLVHDAESISFPEPLHMQFPNADFDYPVVALRDASVFGVHSYYGNEWPFIVEYQTEHGTNQMNPDMTEDMYNVLSDKIEETVSLKQVFTKLLPENADVLEIEQPWVVDQPIGVKDGKEIKVEDVHHAIDVDDGKNVFVAGSERTGYVNVNRLMAWDQQKVLAQAVQALNAKTLKERFDAFINEHHEEPKYAEVTIRFKDDDVRQNVIIQLDHGADPKIDDNIFFYCGGLNDLIGMTDEENAEDFVLVDVEDTIFHSKALFRNDMETPEEDLDSELLEARVKLVDVISQALIDMDGHIELGEQYELDSVPAKGDWKDEGNGHAFMEVIKGEDVTMFYDVHAEKYPLSEIIDKIGYSAVYDLTIAVREAQIAHLIGEDKKMQVVEIVTPGIAPEATKEVEQTKQEQDDIFDVTPAEYDMVRNAVIEHLEKANKDYYLVDIDIPDMIQSAPLAQSWKELREVAAGTTAILLRDAEIKRPGILERYGTTMKAETAVLAYEAVQYAKDALKNQREGMNEKMDAKVQELNDTLKQYNKIRTWIDSMYPLSHPTQSYSIEKRDLASFALLETNEHGTKYASSFVSSELLMKKMDSLQQLMEKFLNQEITEEQMLSVAKTPEDKEAVKKLFDFIETKQKNQSSQEDHSDNNSINLKSSTIMDPKEKEVQEAAAQKAQEQEVSAQVNDTEGKAKKPGRWEKMDYSKYQLPEGATLVSASVVEDAEVKSGMRLDAVVDINGEQKDLSAPLYKNNVEDYQQGKVDSMGLAPILLRKQVAEVMGIELPKSEKRFDLEKDKSEKPVENVKKEADYSKYHMADGTVVEKANVYQDKETKEWKVSALVDGKRMTAKLYPNEVHDYFVKGEDGKRLNKVTAEMLIAKKFGVEAEARKEQKRKENETKTKKVEETKQQNAQKKEEEKKKVEEQKKQEKKSDKVAPAVAHSLAIAAALVGAKRGIWLNPAAKPAPTFFKSAAIISGFNALMMGLHSDANKFKSNVYVNFGKAQSEGMSVKKNQESLRYNFKNWNNYENMYDKNDVITREDYEKLPEEERELYKVKVANEARPVFNIDQTTMASVKQEEYASLVPAPAKVMTVAEQLESLVSANKDKVLIIKAESEDKFVIMGEKVAEVASVLNVLPTKDYDGEKPYIVLAPDAVESALKSLEGKDMTVEVVKELDDPELVERFPDASAIALKGEQMMESIKQQGGKVAVLPFDVDGTAYDAKQDVLQVVEAKTPVVGCERTQALDRVADIYRAAVAYTGASERLNRVTDSDIPENAVRQEKLVQELAAGVMMADAGLPAKLSKENEALVPYWERELKENPKLVDIIERDVNNAVKVLKGIQNGEQVDYSQMRGKPRTEETKLVSRTIAREISALPSAADKTMVIVRDLEAKKAVVLLPAGASSEVNNEIPGLNKKRIAIALKKEGYEDVQFYNAGGELGFKESNGYFKGKEVIEAKLNQYKVEPINRLNISELLKRDDYVEVKELKYTTLNDNRPAFYVRPVDERIKSFVVPATDADLAKFWGAIKGKDSAAINEMRRELGQELYVRVTEHPELKRDVTPAINQELDITRITYANLKKEAQDAGKKDIFKMTAVIDGKRVSKEIERPVYDKLFMVEDKKAFSLALATHVFAEELGIKAGQDVSFREGGQAQVGDHNDAEVQEEQKAAEAPEKTQESRGGFHR